MIENRILNKCCSIILALTVTVTMLLPSMIMPKEVSAGSDSVTIALNTNPQARYRANGKTSLSNYTTRYDKAGSKIKNSSGSILYCLDPLTAAASGIHQTSSLLGYHGLTQYDINYMACGVDYLNRSYEANDAEALAQFFIWEYLNGKATYNATVTATNMTSSAYEVGMSNAKNFAASKADSAKGTGILYTSGNSQPLVQLSVSYDGYAKLKKVTKSNKHLTELCPEQYSLDGAEYVIYADSGLTKQVAMLKTNASGDSKTIELNEGVYYAKEAKAPKGYILDPKTYTLNVKGGETATLNVADEPLFDNLSFKIQKRIEEGADKNLNLEGAEYTVKYYKAFLNKEQVKTANPFRTWVFKTDKNGEVFIKSEYKVDGDELFKNDKGMSVGLLGTYTIEETKAPKGLARTKGIISLQQVKTNQSATGVVVMKDVTDIEKTQKINIKVQKKDAETGETKPQGYGSFAGAKFNVWFYDPLQLMDVFVGTIVTNENGTGELIKLAPGLYTIEEIEAPSGYNKNPNKVKIEARVKELNTAYFDYITTILEKPITVTVDKTSIDEVGIKVSVKGAVLALYKQETGSKISDDSKTAMSFTTLKKIEEWTSDGAPHVFKGLAKGDYLIKEIKTPDGYLPLEEEYRFTVKETEDVQKNDVFNEAIPEVNTVATFDTGAKESLSKEEVTVYDKFEYKKVLKGHPYEIRTKLVEKDNISNVIAENNKEFIPEAYKGEETLKFTFNAKEFEGKRLVVLAELHRLDREGSTLVAVHKDINNIDETVVFPKIKTTATDKKDGGKDLFAGEKQTVKDKASYFNLIIGRIYKVMGRLVDEETGEPILDNGKEVTAEKEFTAMQSNGFVELEFTFNASALAGKTVVVFEDMYQDKIKIATHTDITDKEQSIYIPKITTKLTGKDSETKEFHALEKINLKDTMQYENFIKGKVYYAKGEVVNAKTGKVIQKAEGNFIADEKNGEASLDFIINAKGLEGERLVCFEEIYTVDENGNPDKLVACHKDINDEGQSVRIIKENKPKTGDKSKILYYVLGLLLAGSAILYIRVKKARK